MTRPSPWELRNLLKVTPRFKVIWKIYETRVGLWKSATTPKKFLLMINKNPAGVITPAGFLYFINKW